VSYISPLPQKTAIFNNKHCPSSATILPTKDCDTEISYFQHQAPPLERQPHASAKDRMSRKQVLSGGTCFRDRKMPKNGKIVSRKQVFGLQHVFVTEIVAATQKLAIFNIKHCSSSGRRTPQRRTGRCRKMEDGHSVMFFTENLTLCLSPCPLTDGEY